MVADCGANIFCPTRATGALSIRLAHGDGTFQAAVVCSSGGISTISVGIADVNGDGRLDLLTGSLESNTVSVLPGNGDGTFQPGVTYDSGSGSGPQSIAVADVDGDGKLDLLVANYGDDTVGVLRGNQSPPANIDDDVGLSGVVDVDPLHRLRVPLALYRQPSDLALIFGQHDGFTIKFRPHFQRDRFRRVSPVRINPSLVARRCDGSLSSGIVALMELTPGCRTTQLRTVADASVAYPFLRAFSIKLHPISTSPSELGGPFKLIDPTTVLEHRSTMTRMRHNGWVLSARNALRFHDKSTPSFGSSGRNVKPVGRETRSKSPAISASMSSGNSATRSRRSVSLLGGLCIMIVGNNSDAHSFEGAMNGICRQPSADA